MGKDEKNVLSRRALPVGLSFQTPPLGRGLKNKLGSLIGGELCSFWAEKLLWASSSQDKRPPCIAP